MFSSGVGTPPTTRVSRRAASRASRASVAPSTSSAAPASVTASTTRTATTLRGGLNSRRNVSDQTMMQIEHEEDQQTSGTVVATTNGDRKKASQDKVLVKDESYIVTERKGLPVEIQQAISLAGKLSLSESFSLSRSLS